MVKGDKHFSCKCIDDVHDQIKKITHIINMYRWITDAYVSDFFVKNYWERLPRSWQDFLAGVTPSELTGLLDPTNISIRSVQPLSLMSFKVCVFSLSLRRTAVDMETTSACKSLLDVFCDTPHRMTAEQTCDKKTSYQHTEKQSMKITNENNTHNACFSSVSPCPTVSADLTQHSTADEIPVSCQTPLPILHTEQRELIQIQSLDMSEEYLEKKFDRKEKIVIQSLNKYKIQSVEDSNKTPVNFNPRETTPVKVLSVGPELCMKMHYRSTSEKQIMLEHEKQIVADDTNCCVLETNGDAEKSGFKIADEKRNGWEASKSYGAAAMKNGQCMALDHIFRKHVKPKKQHEIERLSKVISLLCTHCGVDHVIDVGAGLGHLSRLLTFAYDIKVTNVEACKCHAPKAVKFDQETKIYIKKAALKECRQAKEENIKHLSADLQLPSHIVSTISTNMSTTDFLSLVMSSREKQMLTKQQVNKVYSCGNTESVFLQGTRYDRLDENSQELSSMKSSKSDKRSNVMQTYPQIKCSNETYPQTKCSNETYPQTKCSNETYPQTKCSNETYPQTKCSNETYPQTKCSNETYPQIKCLKTSENENEEGIEKNSNKSLLNLADTSVKPGNADNRFVLTSLHACGDLTPTLLRVFVDCTLAVSLVSVGCCYMKLSTSSDLSDGICEENGYPMSEFVNNLPGHQLSFAARELSCHFIEGYCQRLKDNSDQLKIHGYRAAVQHVIAALIPNMECRLTKCTIKNATRMNFEKYVKCVTQKLGLRSKIPAHVLKQAQSCVPLWKNVVAFYVIRLSLAPLIETLVLLDRIVYLHEKGVSSTLVPIFEPRISPRNYVLLASKM